MEYFWKNTMEVESATNFKDLPLRAHVSPASVVRTARVFCAPAALAFLLQPLPRQGGWDARQALVGGTPPPCFCPGLCPAVAVPLPRGLVPPRLAAPPALPCRTPRGGSGMPPPPLGVSLGGSFGHGHGAALRGARLA